MGKKCFLLFYKITRRKLKRGNSLYQSVNSPYRSRWREPFHVFHTVIETRLLANQSSRFQNVIYLIVLRKFLIFQVVIGSALNELSGRTHSVADTKFSFCNYLNISACAATEAVKSFSVSIYNPIARFVDTIVRIPVQSESVAVYGPDGMSVTTDVLPVSKATAVIRGNLGNASFELVFRAERLPPLGFAVYKVKIISRGKYPGFKDSLKKSPNPKEPNGDYVIENEHLRLTFSGDSGRVVDMENLVSSFKQSVDQQFFWYNASVGNKESGQASGAYIFRPNSSKTFTVSDQNHAKVRFREV